MNRSRIAARLSAPDSRLHSGLGGHHGSTIRHYFSPGATLDYQSMAGDLWAGSTIAIALGWIQENIAEPSLVIQRKASGGQETLREHPLIDLLQNPTAGKGYDWHSLVGATALSLGLDGNGYWEGIRSRSGKIVEIWWRPHFEFRPVWPNDGSVFISGYASQIDGRWRAVQSENVVHFRKGLDPRNNRFGLSPVKAQLREVVGDIQSSNYLAGLMRNHAVPSVMISPKSPDVELEDKEREALKRKWQAEYQGENTATVSVSSMSMDVQKVGFSPKELELGTLAHVFESKLLASIGINALVLGLPGASTQNKFSNLAEANMHAYQNCLMPLGARICAGIKQSALGRELLAPNESLAFDWSEVAALRENLARRTEQTSKAFGSASAPGWLTRNEARFQGGYPPIDGGDVFVESLAVQAKQPEPEPRPQPQTKSLPATKSIKANSISPKISPPTPKAELIDRLEEVIRTAVDAAEAEALGGELLREISLLPQEENLATAAIPILESAWDDSGAAITQDFNRIRASADLEAIDWQVFDPNLQSKIRAAAVAFANSTLATMSLQVANAQQKFREELEAGAFSGESSPELQKRLRDVFGLSRAKARSIALTEISRATHQAADESALSSGVVEGWEWLLSADACPVCQAIAQKTVKLGEEFTRIGNHPIYSSIKHPPGHPECNCTVVAILKPEFRVAA